MTPLLCAASNGHVGVIACLWNYGGSIDDIISVRVSRAHYVCALFVIICEQCVAECMHTAWMCSCIPALAAAVLGLSSAGCVAARSWRWLPHCLARDGLGAAAVLRRLAAQQGQGRLPGRNDWGRGGQVTMAALLSCCINTAWDAPRGYRRLTTDVLLGCCACGCWEEMHTRACW
jgi:hypothetical protein